MVAELRQSGRFEIRSETPAVARVNGAAPQLKKCTHVVPTIFGIPFFKNDSCAVADEELLVPAIFQISFCFIRFLCGKGSTYSYFCSTVVANPNNGRLRKVANSKARYPKSNGAINSYIL